jgi:hypothetical protein
MRTRRVASRLGSVVEALNSSPRRAWWTSFVLVMILSGLWAVANPPFAAPDEPEHVIRADALDHGQLTGSHPSRQQAEQFRDRSDYLIVRAPAIYGVAANATRCFAHRPFQSAACFRFDGPTEDGDVGTYVARHPPAYYAVVGTVSLVGRPGSGTVYAMRFLGSLMTAAFVATAITALRRSAASRLLAVGVAIAITPMVLFVSSTVNPSAPEIAASLAFWVCGLVLLGQARDRVDTRLVTAMGVAGIVLALSRQLGPLWLGLIILTMLAIGNRAALRTLARSNWARGWGALVVASCVVQMGWDVIVKPLDVTRSGHAPSDIGTSEIVRLTLGQTAIRYHEMIGWFGWLDTPSPSLTWIPWTIVLGVLLLAAVLWATRRQIPVLCGLVAAAIVVPVVIESATYSDAGTFTWQGRYTLPLAVGVPILTGFVLASTARGRELLTPRLMVVVGVVFVGAHMLAFGQNLRRYTVGYYGDIQFWKSPSWSPPVSPLLLVIAFAIVVVAFGCWLLMVVPRGSGTIRPAGASAAQQTSTPGAERPAASARPGSGSSPLRAS